MNKRILELAEQASVEYIASEQWVFTQEELLKFAESIIKECSDVVINSSADYHAVKRIADQIRWHFGVE